MCLYFKIEFMQTDRFKSAVQNLHDGADSAIDIHHLSIPRDEANTSEGCEYLDDSIRMKEQPYDDTEALRERGNTG